MGLADRDYKKKSQRKIDAKSKSIFSSPKESSATSTLYMVLVWLAIFFVLFKVFRSWEESQKLQMRPPLQGSSHRERQAPPALPQQSHQPPELQENGGTIPSHAPAVTKCTTRNGTTYTDAPCAADAKSTSVRIQLDVNVSDAPVRHSLAAVRASPAVPYTASSSPSSVATAVESYDARLVECEALTGELHHWDERARQPLSGQMQDWIRDKQRSLRARKFELRC